MKRFINWLTDKFSTQEPAAKPGLRQTGAHKIPKPAPARPVKPKPAMRFDIEYSDGVDGEIIDGGPGKNVLIRNKYIREDSGTHETLKIVDDSLLESEEEFGLDPYNTGRFDRSRTWDTSRFRK